MTVAHKLTFQLKIGNTRVVTAAGNVTMDNEGVLIINKTVGAATQVTFQDDPEAGDFLFIKDGKGDAATNNITLVDHDGRTIDGAANLVISENYGAVLLGYNGTEWNVIARGNPLSATELGFLNGVTAGTVTASKASVVDANKDVGTFRNVRATRLIEGQGDATFDNTAGALTITAAMVIGGTLLRDPNGANRTDVLPTAALLVAAVPGATVGDILSVYVANCADAAETITMSAGSGGTWKTTQPAGARIIPQNSSRRVYVRLTNVTGASEAYDAWM